ncbi:hypothetical protein [Streptomyces sp. JNUCC 63]
MTYDYPINTPLFSPTPWVGSFGRSPAGTPQVPMNHPAWSGGLTFLDGLIEPFVRLGYSEVSLQ